jgi:hypothetical protein
VCLAKSREFAHQDVISVDLAQDLQVECESDRQQLEPGRQDQTLDLDRREEAPVASAPVRYGTRTSMAGAGIPWSRDSDRCGREWRPSILTPRMFTTPRVKPEEP